MIQFTFRGRTDNPKGLARFRDDLLRFIHGTVPPDVRPECHILLPLEPVMRFMEASQLLTREQTELGLGLHAVQEVMQEEILTLRAEVARLKGGV